MVANVVERQRLAVLVRELEKQLKDSLDTIFKPWIALADHVRHYFGSYRAYLEEALKFPDLPNRAIFEVRRASPIPVHRDNLGSLAGQIGELAAALEASFSDVLQALDASKREASHLKKENAQLRASIESAKLQLREAERLAYGLALTFCASWALVVVLVGFEALWVFAVSAQLGVPLLGGLLLVPPVTVLASVRKRIGLPGYLETIRNALHSLGGSR